MKYADEVWSLLASAWDVALPWVRTGAGDLRDIVTNQDGARPVAITMAVIMIVLWMLRKPLGRLVKSK